MASPFKSNANFRRLTVHREIAAPLAATWNVMTDLERWPEWTASVTRIERIDGAPLEVGTRVRITQPGLPQAVWTITAWEPPFQFQWVAKGPGFTTIADHTLELTEDGCRAALSIRLEGPAGGLFGWMTRNLTQRYVTMEADGLKARSEGLR